MATWSLFQYKDNLSPYGYFQFKTLWSWNRVIFEMEIPILVRRQIYIEPAPGDILYHILKYDTD